MDPNVVRRFSHAPVRARARPIGAAPRWGRLAGWRDRLRHLDFYLKRRLYTACSLLLVDNTMSMRLRARLLGRLGARIGTGVTVRSGLLVLERFNVSLGTGSFVGNQCVFDCSAPIQVGTQVFIAPGVSLVTGTHAIGTHDLRAGAFTPRGITIGDGCWIGARAVILPGVRIGAGAVVGAGSVVTRDVAPDTVVAGNPARLLRRLDDRPMVDARGGDERLTKTLVHPAEAATPVR